MTYHLTRTLLTFVALTVPSLAIAHGPGLGTGTANAPGWTGQQTPPCATAGATVPPCGTAPGTYGSYGNGMPGPAAGHGPQMMLGNGVPSRPGTGWGYRFGHGPGMNWRN
ncbi:hypothetical protein SAMN04488094_110122 [Tropicimonas isoalkanivorans]|uniref:Uncharacterized protein n=1 Tax=Tropicimonas isoalkanivorans TaxID=441112 RepID=A0A1I1MZC1_9RHOB|nr:hypothetical protein SAMN04488094_110122 [Tropicimonas isoalkanivorans]